MTKVQNKTLHFPSSRVKGEAGATSFPYSALCLCHTVWQCFIISPAKLSVISVFTGYFPNSPKTAVSCVSMCTEFLWFELFFSGMLFCIFYCWWIYCWCLPLPPVCLQQWRPAVTKGKKLLTFRPYLGLVIFLSFSHSNFRDHTFKSYFLFHQIVF